jgi:glyoxylase-like metal-dependent hydrolase (beta-lactamase superfamily II)
MLFYVYVNVNQNRPMPHNPNVPPQPTTPNTPRSAQPTSAELEARLTYPIDGLPALGEVKAIAPGVLWVRMGLPFALDHINLWLLEEADGWTMVDTGVGLPPTRDAWENIFAKHLGGKPIVRVLITHSHPDHVGNAGWVCEKFGALLWATLGEYFQSRILIHGMAGFDNDTQVAHFRRHGLAADLLATIERERGNYFKTLAPEPALSFVRFQDNDVLTLGGHKWRVIVGFGHAPEHASLYCEELKLLISGDMLLPRISTNVGVWPAEPLGNPLQMFLDSITRYLPLPADTMVLPSHGRIFVGIHERVKQLQDHHAERLDALRAALVDAPVPVTAADVIPVLFTRKLDAHQTTFAIGESLAHLHLLMYAGEITRTVGNDHVVRFSKA